MDNERFKVHTYSQSRQLVKSNTLNDEVFNTAIIRLTQALDEEWQQPELEEEIMESIDRVLSGERADAAFALVEYTTNNEMIGFGNLYRDIGYYHKRGYGENLGILGTSFVLPEYRRQGIYSEIVKKREKIAGEIGYHSLVVEVASDESKSVLSKMGYRPFNQEDDSTLYKTLEMRSIEKEPGMNETHTSGFKS